MSNGAPSTSNILLIIKSKSGYFLYSFLCLFLASLKKFFRLLPKPPFTGTLPSIATLLCIHCLAVLPLLLPSCLATFSHKTFVTLAISLALLSLPSAAGRAKNLYICSSLAFLVLPISSNIVSTSDSVDGLEDSPTFSFSSKVESTWLSPLFLVLLLPLSSLLLLSFSSVVCCCVNNALFNSFSNEVFLMGLLIVPFFNL